MPSFTLERFGRLWRGALLLSALGTSCWVSPVAASPPAAPFSIHIKVTGGYRFAGTLSSYFSNFDYFCALSKDPTSKSTRQYGLYFGLTRFGKALKGDFSKDALILTIDRYKPTVTSYHDTLYDQISIVIRRHAYSSGQQLDPKYRVSVHIAHDGLSGNFKATHVSAMAKFRGKPVNIQGNWTCDTVLKGG